MKHLKRFNENFDSRIDEVQLMYRIEKMDEYSVLELIDTLSEKYPNIDLSEWNETKEIKDRYSDDYNSDDFDSYAADAHNDYWKSLHWVPIQFIKEPGALDIILNKIGN